jgi:transposase
LYQHRSASARERLPVLFVFYPKHEFGCRQVEHCPHLGGASLGSLVHAADGNQEWTDALLRQVDALREENADNARTIAQQQERIEQLERELKAERQKQFKASKGEEEVPAVAIKDEAGAARRGAPVGHPGWFRPTPITIDRTILVPAPATCPFCHRRVVARPDLPPYDHVQEDLVEGLRTTTCYRHEEARCSNRQCRRWVRQAGAGEILRAKIGPEMRGRALFLRFGIGLPLRKVVAAIGGLDCLSFTPAALLGFEVQAAERARPLAHDVGLKLRACDAVHADETSYRIDARSAYAWFHGNEHLAHFYICGTRSGKISRRILGRDYAGGLVTDCYAGYSRHATKIKQRCVEHLKRTARDWRKVTAEKAAAARQFFDDVMAWAKRCCRWHRRWKAGSGPEKDREAAWLRHEQARLEGVPLDEKKALTLQGRIRRYSREWLTFLDHPGIPPTNNLAEQAIRFLVVMRKLTFGSRTRSGARRTGVMMTVVQTAKRQGRNVIRFLVALFTRTPNEAARAMYARC